MRELRTALWTLGCAWLLVACNNAGGPGSVVAPPISVTPPPGTGGTDQRVCPSCRELGGGQTGDFNGVKGDPGCASVERPISDEVRRAFRLDEIRQLVQAPFTKRLQWGHSKRFADLVHLDTRAEQFEPQGETDIDVMIELGAFKYSVSPCGGEAVGAPLTVTFSTKDGALAATLRADTLSVSPAIDGPEGAPPIFGGTVYASLSDATGTLDIPIDESRIHEGRLIFQFRSLPGGLRGYLAIELDYFADQKAYDAYHTELSSINVDAFTVMVDSFTVMEAMFPIDECSANAFPLAADKPNVWFGGESPTSAIARAQAAHGPQAFTAQWLDGTLTQVDLDLGTPPSGTLCVEWGDAPYFGFPTMAHVRSDDARIDLELTKADALMRGASGDVVELDFGAGTSPLAPADFAAASGIRVNAGQHRLLVGGIEIFEVWDSSRSDPSSGYMEVHDPDTSEMIDCLLWPRPASGMLTANCLPVP